MVLIDSSVWVSYFNGELTPETIQLDSLVGEELICVGDLILAEVLQGFRHDHHFQQARTLLLSLEFVNLLGKSIALRSAQHFRQLRKAGITVRKTNDCIIATWCIEHGVPLLQADRDFLPFHEYLGLQLL